MTFYDVTITSDQPERAKMRRGALEKVCCHLPSDNWTRYVDLLIMDEQAWWHNTYLWSSIPIHNYIIKQLLTFVFGQYVCLQTWKSTILTSASTSVNIGFSGLQTNILTSTKVNNCIVLHASTKMLYLNKYLTTINYINYIYN